MFCTGVAWVCLVCLLLCKEEDSSPVSLQLLSGRDDGFVWGDLVCVVVGFGMGTLLANFHMWGSMLLFRSSVKHTRGKCDSKRTYVILGA